MKLTRSRARQVRMDEDLLNQAESETARESSCSFPPREFVWLACDFILDKEGFPWLLEVNAKPASRYEVRTYGHRG